MIYKKYMKLPLSLILIALAVFQTALNAGRRQVVYPRSDPRSRTKEGRFQITDERVKESARRGIVINAIGLVLYNKDLAESEKVKQITEMTSLFDMTLPQLQEYQKMQEQKTAKALEESARLEKQVEEAKRKLKEAEGKAYSSAEEKNRAVQKAKEELEKANNRWSTTKKVVAGLVIGTAVAGGIVAFAFPGAITAAGASVSAALTPYVPAAVSTMLGKARDYVWSWGRKAATDAAKSLVAGGDQPPSSETESSESPGAPPTTSPGGPAPGRTPTTSPGAGQRPSARAQSPSASAPKPGQKPTARNLTPLTQRDAGEGAPSASGVGRVPIPESSTRRVRPPAPTPGQQSLPPVSPTISPTPTTGTGGQATQQKPPTAPAPAPGAGQPPSPTPPKTVPEKPGGWGLGGLGRFFGRGETPKTESPAPTAEAGEKSESPAQEPLKTGGGLFGGFWRS